MYSKHSIEIYREGDKEDQLHNGHRQYKGQGDHDSILQSSECDVSSESFSYIIMYRS